LDDDPGEVSQFPPPRMEPIARSTGVPQGADPRFGGRCGGTVSGGAGGGGLRFGYQEAARQAQSRGAIMNKLSLERSLQLGISEESARLERNMSWLATTATVSPFVGLFGTVLGIIDAFSGLGAAGSASLRAVAPAFPRR